MEPAAAFSSSLLRAYDSEKIALFAQAGFRLARRRRHKLSSVDKANVMVSGRL